MRHGQMASHDLRSRLLGVMDINNYLYQYHIHNNPVTKTASIFWYGRNGALTDCIHGYPDVESARQDAQAAIEALRTEHPPTRDQYHRYTVFQIDKITNRWGVRWYQRDGSLKAEIPGFMSYEHAVRTSDICWQAHHSELQSLPMSMLDSTGVRRPVNQPASTQSYTAPLPVKVKTFDEKWADGIKAFVKDSK